MLQRVTGWMLAMLVGAGCVAAADATIDDALALFPPGGDVAIGYDEDGRAVLEAAIEVLETALGVTPLFEHSDEAAYMNLEIPAVRKPWVNNLSQAYYTLGDVFLTEAGAEKAMFTRGQYWGLKSLRMNPAFTAAELRHGFVSAARQETDVAALYWTYANWARKDEYDPLGAIARNDPPKLVALIERALEVDESYMAYGSYRALAAFWGGLPPLPLITYGQNLPRALSYICPVIDEPAYCTECPNCPVDPDAGEYFENRLIFAEYYLMKRKLWGEAARILGSILDDEIGERHPLYNAYCQERARVLLADVEKRL